MRCLLNGFLLTLMAGTALAESPPKVWFSPCGGPVATCVRPGTLHSLKDACGGCSSQPACCSNVEPARIRPTADPTRDVLDDWETASRSFYPVTRAERMRLLAETPGLTGQQLNLICEFRQPVRSTELRQRFDWRTHRRDSDRITLIAVPKEKLERLFYDSVTVEIERTSVCPIAVSFEGEIGSVGGLNHAIALRPWVDPSELDVQLVGFESSRDDTPALVRTADASDEISSTAPETVPRRLNLIDDRLTPPPLPGATACPVPVPTIDE